MPEITYVDEPEAPTGSKSTKMQTKKGLLVFVALVSLIMGSLGGAASVVALFSYGFTDGLNLKNGEPIIERLGTDKLILEESSAITDTVNKVSPAVVSISTTTNVQDFFGRVFQQNGGGTGFILTSDGLIVTNRHVVDDENATYTVFTDDGRDFQAEVLAKDTLNDLAVLKIEATGLPVVELGSSDDLKIGQWVVAIGNALGEFSNSVTAGIISAKERQITAGGGGVSEELSGLLQTDAAINPGNSGGPLVNLRGQVVGINTAVAGNAENIGFAIPINLVKKAIDSVKTTGEIKRPMIGIRYIPITKEVAQVNQLSVDHGVWLLPGTTQGEVAVIPGSPADKAGLEENDIITAIDGKEINEHNTLLSILANYDIGQTISLTVQHKGEEKEVDLTLEEK
ncbi:trypsin-like peptidase domain-containing protein [Candidatus Berkelbacteria bacterium]|nr:trypsin-like peptidase domain-containing protein [Candidatus Berkelbacteria bacterium]